MKYQPVETWAEALELTGDVLRPGASEGSNDRTRTLARSYKVNTAARRLGFKRGTIEEALILTFLTSFVDPEGMVRIPAKAVEAAAQDPEYYEKIASLEIIHAADLAAVAGMPLKSIRRKLQAIGADRKRPEWGQVRGLWGLPEVYSEFLEQLEENETAGQEDLEEFLRHERKRASEEKERRAKLKQRLVDAFPDWIHADREQQEVVLHVGPPNSGKTHDSLEALIAAGSGWYLAPLRLLAYEIFDRLNQRGVPCNLLTGEEYIPIEGAKFTAATIEMFNSSESGECIIIDEAQMLADPDRGWAWTRAMIEANCPEIHMIGPEPARQLILQMAKAAELPIRIQEHKRLTPIEVADQHWSLAKLPPQTILVAFSRRRVLELKQELEKRGRRVSVVYGSLPPEVRRRQSERFANRETEICVATDAVGMGLNLPADNVCFYEIEKFDGKTSRKLYPEEVQQIGGRAGRYGISQAGRVGATTRYNLRYIRKTFHRDPRTLTRARVAPTLQDLEMIPGTLAQKFIEWSQLRSIPPALRNLIQITNLEERISLAQMLTDEEVNKLGLNASVKLVNAPTRISTRSYWRMCARAIIDERSMPLPPPPPPDILNTNDLQNTEHSVSCADIYLWLGHRDSFTDFAPDSAHVRNLRQTWSDMIDGALLKKIKNVKVCSQCQKILPADYPFGMCESCYYSSRYRYDNDFE